MILFFRYLTWKNTFRARPSTNKQVQLRKICSICEALNSPLDKWPEKSYPHIQDWWRGTPENWWIHLYFHTLLDVHLFILNGYESTLLMYCIWYLGIVRRQWKNIRQVWCSGFRLVLKRGWRNFIVSFSSLFFCLF